MVTMLDYISVCSGIEAATVAAKGLPMRPLAFSEIEDFPCTLLQHHYPNIPLHGDFTTMKGTEYGSARLLIGGTPCQDFSIAGQRLGMDAPRGNLAIEYLRLAVRSGVQWILWENVPGILSSWSDGKRAGFESNDFDTFLNLMGECGFGVAWRVLDAQHFGVPQRRRRVFVVGYLGDWRPAAAVLFERDCLQRNITPRRETRQRAASGSAESAGESSGIPYRMTAFGEYADDDTASALKARDYKDATDLIAFNARQDPVPNESVTGALDCYTNTHAICHPINDKATRYKGGGDTRSNDGSANGLGIGNNGDPSPTLDTSSRHAVAFTQNSRDEVRMIGGDGDMVGAIAANHGSKQQNYLYQNMAVRRFTPVECERLMGFEDNYTLVPYKGKLATDGHRYKAIGNSMPVPVMRWIQDRICKVDAIMEDLRGRQ